MTRAYSDLYIEEAMSNLADMMDYGVNVLGEEMEQFYSRFLASRVAGQISCGNPKYLCMPGIRLATLVAQQTGIEAEEAETATSIMTQEYWVGSAMAYLQWYYNMSFQSLHTKGVTASTIAPYCFALRNEDLSRTVEVADEMLKDYDQAHTPLKTARKNAGLTQRQLAEQSGVPLRTIRAYEQSRIVGGRASAQAMYNIASILGCPLDYLLGTQDKIR